MEEIKAKTVCDLSVNNGIFRLQEVIWKVLPFTRRKPDVARRFFGRIDWNGLTVNKREMLHSIAFKSNRWIDMVGFEMLRGESSFQISYTITKGHGVLGKVIRKGTAFVPLGDMLHPSRQIKLRSPLRIEPEVWYCINIIIEIHEYEMYVSTSSGTDGRAMIETDSDVRIEYAAGLDSSDKTSLSSGQIAGISFYCIDSREEEFLKTQLPLFVKPIGTPAETSVKDIAIGDSLPMLPDPVIHSHVPYEPSIEPIIECEPTRSLEEAPQILVDPEKTATSLRGSVTKYVLPPVAGVISPPVRSQAVVRDIPPYK